MKQYTVVQLEESTQELAEFGTFHDLENAKARLEDLRSISNATIGISVDNYIENRRGELKFDEHIQTICQDNDGAYDEEI